MEVLDQLLALPYVYILPGFVFLLVVGGVYWLTRSSPPQAAEPTGEDDDAVQSVLAPKQKNQRGVFRKRGNPVVVHIGKPDDKKDPGGRQRAGPLRGRLAARAHS